MFAYGDIVQYIGEDEHIDGLVKEERYTALGNKKIDGKDYVWLSNISMPFYGSFCGWVKSEDVVSVGQ